MRVILAFAAASLAPALVHGIAVGERAAVVAVAIFSIPFALGLGAPCYLLFMRLGWLRLWHIAAASMLLGLLAFLVLLSVFGFGNGPLLFMASMFCGYGLLSGVVFWLVAFAGQSSNKALQGDVPRPAGSGRA